MCLAFVVLFATINILWHPVKVHCLVLPLLTVLETEVASMARSDYAVNLLLAILT